MKGLMDTYQVEFKSYKAEGTFVRLIFADSEQEAINKIRNSIPEIKEIINIDKI